VVAICDHLRFLLCRQLKHEIGGKDELGFIGVRYLIQVKQKGKAGRPDIDSFEAAMQPCSRLFIEIINLDLELLWSKLYVYGGRQWATRSSLCHC
jgi:hypothetical protein